MGSPALRLPVLAFVASVAGACFINSIRGEFVIDDFSAIANNQVCQNKNQIRHLPSI